MTAPRTTERGSRPDPVPEPGPDAAPTADDTAAHSPIDDQTALSPARERDTDDEQVRPGPDGGGLGGGLVPSPRDAEPADEQLVGELSGDEAAETAATAGPEPAVGATGVRDACVHEGDANPPAPVGTSTPHKDLSTDGDDARDADWLSELKAPLSEQTISPGDAVGAAEGAGPFSKGQGPAAPEAYDRGGERAGDGAGASAAADIGRPSESPPGLAPSEAPQPRSGNGAVHLAGEAPELGAAGGSDRGARGEREHGAGADPEPRAGGEREHGAGQAAGSDAGRPRPGTGARTGAAGAGVPARRAGVRRGSADPVKALMHRHRDLCERAVDPLEIAAGLEAHGVTDRTAARFRHRDVFSLAEELFARVPRDETHARVSLESAVQALPGGRRLLYVLPGATCVAAAVAVASVPGSTSGVRLAIGAAAALVVAVTLRACLRRGPLSVPRGAAGATALWACWLLGYQLFGEAVLRRVSGPSVPVPAAHGTEGWVPGLLSAAIGAPGSYGASGAGAAVSATAPVALTASAAVALAFAVVPAAWCARRYSARARGRLATSRGPQEFTARARPLLPGAVGLFLLTLAGLVVLIATAALAVSAYGDRWTSPGAATAAGGPYGIEAFASYVVGAGPASAARAMAPVVALGVLLFTARLLAVHGRARAAAYGLAAACAVEAAALAMALAGRVPEGRALLKPVETALAVAGPGAVPLAACTVAALCLVAHATVALSRASAHAEPPAPPR